MDYIPPLSPDIVFNFNSPSVAYVPPLSPTIVFNFGETVDPPGESYLRSSYTILLTM